MRGAHFASVAQGGQRVGGGRARGREYDAVRDECAQFGSTAVATVGLAMAALSAAVAVSGLAIPLPEFVYRVAAVVGVLGDPRDDRAPRRETAPDRVVILPHE